VTLSKGVGTFCPEDMAALDADMKVGLLATVTPDGLPHVTLISTLKAGAEDQVIWGQFVEGRSKSYIRENPKCGFLVMTLDKNLWWGKATFTHTARQGPEYEMYNNTPMFRYNAYFGVHTVYFMELVEQSGRLPLPMMRVVLAAVQTMIARSLSGEKGSQDVLNPWTRMLMNKLDSLKFLSYLGTDGFPVVLPVIEAQAADSEHVVFSMSPFGERLLPMKEGATVAVFGMTLDMEDVLLRGEFLGFRRKSGVSYGRVRVNWVCNPMPPIPGRIYPPVPIVPVTEF